MYELAASQATPKGVAIYEKPMTTEQSPHNVDLLVIGGGSGGVRAARIAANHGASVMIAEESRWGGTCVVRGCVPKKLFVYASEVSAQIADAAGFGWSIPHAKFDWPTLVANKDREIARLSGLYTELLGKAGVRTIEARARILGPHLVEVGGHQVTAGKILIATGGRPRRPSLHHVRRSVPLKNAATSDRGAGRRLHRR